METRWKLNAWKDLGSGRGFQGWDLPESPALYNSTVILNPVSRDDITPPLAAIERSADGAVPPAEKRTGGSRSQRSLLCLDAETGFEVTREFQPLTARECGSARRKQEQEFVANVPPTIANGRLLFRYNRLLVFDLRDKTRFAEEPARAEPAAAAKTAPSAWAEECRRFEADEGTRTLLRKLDAWIEEDRMAAGADPGVVAVALETLSRTEVLDPEAAPVLIPLLSSTSDLWATQSATVLGRLGPDAAAAVKTMRSDAESVPEDEVTP